MKNKQIYLLIEREKRFEQLVRLLAHRESYGSTRVLEDAIEQAQRDYENAKTALANTL